MTLSLCPTREFVSADNLSRYADTARELGASFIQILEPRAIGRYAGEDVALDARQQRLLEQFAERMNADLAAEYPKVRYVDWSARAFGCHGAGDRYLYIDTDGAVHACPFCRTHGVTLLDRDMDSAISMLQRVGCPASCGSATARTAS